MTAPVSPIATQETAYRELAETKGRLIGAFEEAEDTGAEAILVNATDVRAVVDDHDRLWLALSSAERRIEGLVRAFRPFVEYLHVGDPRYDEGTVPVTGEEYRAAVAAWIAAGGDPKLVDVDETAPNHWTRLAESEPLVTTLKAEVKELKRERDAL